MARPRVYKSSYPEELLELMKQGALDCEIFAHWGISKDTFYRWLKEYSKLKEAHDSGLPLCEAWWIAKGKKFMEEGNNKAFNFWISLMNNKFKYSHKESGNIDKQININSMTILQDKSPQELIEYIQSTTKELPLIELQVDKEDNGFNK